MENTGSEIRPQDVRRLAEPFERLHRDCTGPGAGLGLSIVRAVADAHGARLELTRGPAAGSSPRWPSQLPVRQHARAQALDLRWRERRRAQLVVLVVSAEQVGDVVHPLREL